MGCARCGAPTLPFVKSGRYRKYCSPVCQYGKTARAADLQRDRRLARYAGRRAAELGVSVEEWQAQKWTLGRSPHVSDQGWKLAKKFDMQCVTCGTPFKAAARHAKYCGDDCKPTGKWRSSPTKLSGAERGYGHAHQKARKEALARMRGGDPCCLCGEPMFRGEMLHLDHDEARTGYRGLAHGGCNVRDGAIRGNQRRQEMDRALTTSRSW